MQEDFPDFDLLILLDSLCGPLLPADRDGVPENLQGALSRFLELVRGRKLPRRDFPELKSLFDRNPLLRQLAAGLDTARARRMRTLGARVPDLFSLLTGRARFALLAGNADSFNSLYEQYRHLPVAEWTQSGAHVWFWNEVLGERWYGSESIPPGAGQADFMRLLAERCVFSSLPPGSRVHEAVLPPLSALSWQMVRGLSLPACDAPEFSACREMLWGNWDAAHSLFRSAIPLTFDRECALRDAGGGALPIFAVLNGWRAGKGGKVLLQWLELAERLLSGNGQISSVESPVLQAFFFNLRLLLAISDATPVGDCRFMLAGGISVLPPALVYEQLPIPLRSSLRLDYLVDGVVQLWQDGLLLPAGYAAASLLKQAPLTESQRAALRDVMADFHAVPFFPPEEVDSALYWDLEAAEDDELISYGPSIRGELPAAEDMSAACTDARDLLLWRRYQSNPEVGPDLLPLLAVHPRLRLCRAGGVQPVTINAPLREVLVEPAGRGTLRVTEPVADVCRLRRVAPAVYEWELLRESHLCETPGADILSGSRWLGTDIQEIPLFWDDSARELTIQSPAQPGLLVRYKGVTVAADVLRALEQMDATLHWHSSVLMVDYPTTRIEPLILRFLSEDSLEMVCRLAGEPRLWSLEELSAAFLRREGSFLPLGEGRWLHLSRGDVELLSILLDVRVSHSHHYAVSLAVLPQLVARYGDALLPPHAMWLRQGILAPENTAPPEELRVQLRPYQLEGYRWLLVRAALGLGACLADDMGLGKTIQFLALALQLAGKGPSLLVAPLSLLRQWQQECATFAPSLRVLTQADAPADYQPGDLLLLSYGQLVAAADQICARSWNVVALDEAQQIKNPDSQRARTVCRLRARFRLCLTGTPIENKLTDLWSLLHFLNPSLAGRKASFGARMRKSAFRRVVSSLILRRTRAQVLPQLPALWEKDITVELSAAEREVYAAICRCAGEGEQSRIHLLAALTALRRACCHASLADSSFAGESTKLSMMLRLVSSIRSCGGSVLIFSQFTDVLDLAQQLLHGSGIRTCRLDGHTPPAERQKAVDAFMQRREHVFLISLMAGGTGLNLTAADYVILLDPWWNPAAEAQAAARAHRPGREHPVTLYRLIARDSLEERIRVLQQHKLTLAEDALDLPSLSTEQLLELMR